MVCIFFACIFPLGFSKNIFARQALIKLYLELRAASSRPNTLCAGFLGQGYSVIRGLRELSRVIRIIIVIFFLFFAVMDLGTPAGSAADGRVKSAVFFLGLFVSFVST